MSYNSKFNHCLVFAIDDNYVNQFYIVIDSMYSNNNWIKNESIFLLYSKRNLRSENINKISIELYKRYHIEINWLCCDFYLNNSLRIHQKDHVSISTYYRLFLYDLLPLDYQYALYLDSDILILEDISDLYFYEPTQAIAAVENYAASESIRLWGDTGGSYFNAGVLKFNLSNCRLNNFLSQYLEVLKNSNEDLKCWDQDVLNMVHKNDWERLNYYYNVTRHLLESFKIVNQNFFKKIDKSKFKIIHFDGPIKPWQLKSIHPYTNRWRYYQKKLRISYSEIYYFIQNVSFLIFSILKSTKVYFNSILIVFKI